MKLVYLFVVGLVNLILGFGIAQWLKQQCSQQTAPDSQSEPKEDTESQSDLVDSASSDTKDSDVPQPSHEISSTPEKTAREADQGDGTSEVEEAAQDGIDTTSPHNTSVASEATPVEPPGTDSLDSAVSRLLDKLDQEVAGLEHQRQVVDETNSASELKGAAAVVSNAVQALLQEVNATVSELSELDNNPTAMMDRLEGCWSDINDRAVPLVTLDTADQDQEAVQIKLKDICAEILEACQQARESITTGLPV